MFKVIHQVPHPHNCWENPHVLGAQDASLYQGSIIECEDCGNRFRKQVLAGGGAWCWLLITEQEQK